ncbi:MAG: hypothetical protein QNL39_08955 [Akkermansiaceae bacterium]
MNREAQITQYSKIFYCLFWNSKWYKSPTNATTYQNYEVKLSVKQHVIDKKFKLTAFTDTARVHVKNK